MNAAEAINTVYFLFLIALAWRRPWRVRQRRARITMLGAIGLGGVGLSVAAGTMMAHPAVSVARNLIPAGLMLVAYWQAGFFFVRPNRRLQRVLAQFDNRLREALPHSLRRQRRWMAAFLEFAYLLCYPVIPLGAAALYCLRSAHLMNEYWMLVLLPTYGCNITVAFIQVLPPWALENTQQVRRAAFQGLNSWINRQLSIRVNTFPSAHVAASLGVAEALLQASRPVGWVFLAIAISIAVAAAVRRYHYALDVLLGAALALVTLLCTRILR